MRREPAAAATVLVVEDDHETRAALSRELRGRGYRVEEAEDGRSALRHWDARRPDVILLDLGLPDMDGIEVIKRVRREAQTPIVILSGRYDEREKVAALDRGADDYVTKPFVFRELLLRIQNVLKRAHYLQQPDASGGPVHIGIAEVDFGRFTARVDKEVHRLTHKECVVLKLLVERAGNAVTRDEILDRAWSQDEFPTQRTVDNFIVRLRRLVERDPSHPQTILSVRGVGYQLEAGHD